MRGVDLKKLKRERQKIVDFWNNTNPKRYFWIDTEYVEPEEYTQENDLKPDLKHFNGIKILEYT